MVRFSINSSMVIFSLLFSYRLLCCCRFPVYLFIFYIFACFLEGKLKKQTQTKQNRKKIDQYQYLGNGPPTPHLTQHSP